MVRPPLSSPKLPKKSGQNRKKAVDHSGFCGIINNVNGANDGAKNNEKKQQNQSYEC